MKKHLPRFSFLFIAISFLMLPGLVMGQGKANDLAAFANPLIGTKGIWFYGRTTPYVTPPFGMTHWTACTRNSRIRIPNYNYYDTHIIGFRASHKPAMWMGDYGFVTLKPTTGIVNEKSLHQ